MTAMPGWMRSISRRLVSADAIMSSRAESGLPSLSAAGMPCASRSWTSTLLSSVMTSASADTLAFAA